MFMIFSNDIVSFSESNSNKINSITIPFPQIQILRHHLIVNIFIIKISKCCGPTSTNSTCKSLACTSKSHSPAACSCGGDAETKKSPQRKSCSSQAAKNPSRCARNWAWSPAARTSTAYSPQSPPRSTSWSWRQATPTSPAASTTYNWQMCSRATTRPTLSPRATMWAYRTAPPRTACCISCSRLDACRRLRAMWVLVSRCPSIRPRRWGIRRSRLERRRGACRVTIGIRVRSVSWSLVSNSRRIGPSATPSTARNPIPNYSHPNNNNHNHKQTKPSTNCSK